MASQSTKPPEPADEAPAVSKPPASAKLRVGRYVDRTARTYHWSDGPQTAEFDDVCALPPEFDDVDDGRWAPSKGVITRLRDNHPDEVEKTSIRQAAARRKAHEEAAEAETAAREAAKGGEQR